MRQAVDRYGSVTQGIELFVGNARKQKLARVRCRFPFVAYPATNGRLPLWTSADQEQKRRRRAEVGFVAGTSSKPGLGAGIVGWGHIWWCVRRDCSGAVKEGAAMA